MALSANGYKQVLGQKKHFLEQFDPKFLQCLGECDQQRYQSKSSNHQRQNGRYKYLSLGRDQSRNLFQGN